MVPRSEEAFAEMGASSHVIPHPVRRANTAWALRFTWSGKDEINGQLEIRTLRIGRPTKDGGLSKGAGRPLHRPSPRVFSHRGRSEQALA